MVSGSSSSPLMFLGTVGVDHMNPMTNSRQDSNFVLPTALPPAQLHHHLIAPADQTMIHGPSCKTDPETEVAIAVSPNTLLADGNRFICDICYKGFPRQQNLQLHGRVHNLPFKLRARRGVVQRKVYLCPVPTCAHHNRARALSDFGGLKKHYLRKHSNEKKHECNSCSKKYAVESDLKAHLKICGKKKYNCSCGAPFSRHSHFAFHQAFCDGQEQEDASKHPPTSDVGNSSVGSTSNNNSSLIGSPTLDLPTLNMGENNNNNSSSNDNSSSVIGSTTPPLDHESLVTPDPSLGLNLIENTAAFFSPSPTPQNQLQGKFGTGFYTNLLMNTNPYNNLDLNSIAFMGEGGIYGSEEAGANSFTGGGIMLDHSSSLHSTSVVYKATLREQLSTPQLFLNDDVLGFTSRNNKSNMVQGHISSSSSGVGGFMMPQEHSAFGSKYLGIANNIGYNTIPNELQNPVNGNDVGSAIFNHDVGGSYMQGGYYGFGDGNNHHDY
ncbi:protein indeterminate-domain 2-like [Cynara cardunculus var. scolymus]|uniref:Zinc finger, C2H2 n=1 Tax=Cynara cardunculus var. scolymus TaxID=59895 RepID=A0A103XV71_CYNCS|nr:protein indeterminate-domain 2-like [Cynara cardunculus var. scolymus]KVH97504.1 Zinc finger, C2H2 [Cynara cardunculus var. scolymus]